MLIEDFQLPIEDRKSKIKAPVLIDQTEYLDNTLKDLDNTLSVH